MHASLAVSGYICLIGVWLWKHWRFGLERTAAKPARVLPRLEQFPGRTADVIRFGDLDPQGHVNNTVFATFFETGRVMLLREPGN